MPAKIEIKQEWIDKTQELFAEGLGARKIAKKLGTSRRVVQNIYELLGIDARGRARPLSAKQNNLDGARRTRHKTA